MKSYLRWITHPLFILTGITIVFFWMTFFKGNIPFPGDFLLSEYSPWKQSSYFGYVAGSIPHKAQYFDVVRELYPWKTLVVRELKSGHVPLWNPYNFAGGPLMANYQSQVWYPLSFVYLVLPQPIAWTVLIILQILLGLIFTYLFAHVIGLSTAASILAAVLFNLSSFSTVWLEFNTVWHTMLWIPLILYIFERRLKNVLPYWRLLFVGALLSSMTAGHPQDFINSLLFVGIYMLARLVYLSEKTIKEKKTIALELLGLTGITMLIGGVQLLPTVQLFAASARVPHDVGFIVHNMLIQAWQLPIAIIADFFGNPATRTYVLEDTYINKSLSIGTVGFLLVVISFWSKKTYHMKFFALIAMLLLLLTTNNPISQLFYQFPLPLLSTGTPTRNLFIYIFSISMLAAIGYDALKHRMTITKPLFLIGLLFLGIFALYISKPTLLYPFTLITAAAMKKSFIIATVLAILTTLNIVVSKKIPLIRIGIIVLATVELFWGFSKFNTFVPTSYVFPPSNIFTYLQEHAGINRFWGYGTARVEANFATQYGIYSPDGTDPLNLKWYNSLVQSSKDGVIHQEFTRSTRSDANIQPGYGEVDLPENSFRLRILDTLGVRYILDRVENPKNDQTFSPIRFKPVWHENDWTIYENLLAAPRYFLTSDIQYYETDKEFEKLFFHPTFDPKSTILLAKDTQTPKIEKAISAGTAELLSYTPNQLQLKTTTTTAQMLFLSDTYDKGWKADIDGKQADILKADYAFRAIFVPSGTHTVTMIYRPDAFIYGVVASSAGFVLLCMLLWQSRRRPS